MEAEGEERGAGFRFVAFFEGFEEMDPVGRVGAKAGCWARKCLVPEKKDQPVFWRWWIWVKMSEAAVEVRASAGQGWRRGRRWEVVFDEAVLVLSEERVHKDKWLFYSIKAILA